MDRVDFGGFSPTLFRFLRSLAQNNTKEWLEDNRGSYETRVLAPIKFLAGELDYFLRNLRGDLETGPKVGRTISRISNDLRFNRNRSSYRPFIYIGFPRRGAKLASEALLFVGVFGHGVSAGFYPGGQRGLHSGPVQEAISKNQRLFQRYLDERRIPERYSEIAGGEDGCVTRWPLPKTARRWVSLESFTVGEYFEASDPLLASRRFRDRVLKIMLDLYPLWLFATSDNIREDLELYRENAGLITRPLSVAAD